MEHSHRNDGWGPAGFPAVFVFCDDYPRIAPCSGSKGGDFHRAQSYQLLTWGHVAAKLPIDLFNAKELVPPVNNIVFRSDHPGGVQFVMLDGSVHFISDDSERRVRNALVTRSGGEVEAALE